MITLFDDAQNELTRDSIQTIFRLLNITQPPDITDFLNDSEEEEKSFHYFFFEVLIENDIPCALTVDWKWHPEDVFWQLERYFAENTIKLTSSEWVESDKSYHVEYEFDGAQTKLVVAFENPQPLLEAISQHLKDSMVICVDFLQDDFSWLIVPKTLDIELFCTLTGFSTERPKHILPSHFAKNYKHSKKIFFRPSVIYVDDNGTRHKLSNQEWAGRILPGQTTEEGIATELKAALHYTGRFDYSYNYFEGTFKDRKGNAIERYSITIYLFDNPFKSRQN